MEDLPTDILLHELGEWLYPFERFKLCGISRIFNQIFNINHFKFNHQHYKYDCNYYTKHLQPYFHDHTLHLSQNAISQLNKLQLQHLKYLVIFHEKLYQIYKSLLISSSSSSSAHPLSISSSLKTAKISNRHISSSSSSTIISSSNNPFLPLRQRKSSSTLLDLQSYADNPFLNALKCINSIDLNKSASSFAIKPYNIKFLCDILQCGFNVNSISSQSKEKLLRRPTLYKYKSLDHESKWNEHYQRRENRKNKPFSLNLSGNNLNANHIGLICKALLNRKKTLNLSKLDLSINHNISDLCVRLLFKCIGEKCQKLQSIDLSYANITDLSCDIIYNFYYKYFIQNNHVLLHKIDLSFTRISENGLVTLDELFNELPKQIKYIHNKHSNTKRINNEKVSDKRKRAKNSQQNDQNENNKMCRKQSDGQHLETKTETEIKANIDPLFETHRRSKSQSFEIVLKGCFFEPMLCKNYNCLASIPKLQTHCPIKADSVELQDLD